MLETGIKAPEFSLPDQKCHFWYSVFKFAQLILRYPVIPVLWPCRGDAGCGGF